MKTYLEKLKDPRWQKKRLEIFERDGWECRCCKDKTETLCVHHKVYLKGKEPWEYPDTLLITLCENCHYNETVIRKILENGFIQMLRTHCLLPGLFDFLEQSWRPTKGNEDAKRIWVRIIDEIISAEPKGENPL